MEKNDSGDKVGSIIIISFLVLLVGLLGGFLFYLNKSFENEKLIREQFNGFVDSMSKPEPDIDVDNIILDVRPAFDTINNIDSDILSEYLTLKDETNMDDQQYENVLRILSECGIYDFRYNRYLEYYEGYYEGYDIYEIEIDGEDYYGFDLYINEDNELCYIGYMDFFMYDNGDVYFTVDDVLFSEEEKKEYLVKSMTQLELDYPNSTITYDEDWGPFVVMAGPEDDWVEVIGYAFIDTEDGDELYEYFEYDFIKGVLDTGEDISA